MPILRYAAVCLRLFYALCAMFTLLAAVDLPPSYQCHEHNTELPTMSRRHYIVYRHVIIVISHAVHITCTFTNAARYERGALHTPVAMLFSRCYAAAASDFHYAFAAIIAAARCCWLPLYDAGYTYAASIRRFTAAAAAATLRR